MFLDLKNIGSAGLQFDRRIPVPDLEGAGGEKVAVSSASLVGGVTKASGGFDLDAKMRAEVETRCSRCVEPVRIVIASDVQLLLVASEGKQGNEAEAKQEADEPGEPGESGELDEDAEAFRFDCPDGKANLVELVSEQIYLELPLKPVCREDCKGLCPECGVNRNDESCGCQAEWIDPRLAPLQRLRDSLKRNEAD